MYGTGLTSCWPTGPRNSPFKSVVCSRMRHSGEAWEAKRAVSSNSAIAGRRRSISWKSSTGSSWDGARCREVPRTRLVTRHRVEAGAGRQGERLRRSGGFDPGPGVASEEGRLAGEVEGGRKLLRRARPAHLVRGVVEVALADHRREHLRVAWSVPVLRVVPKAPHSDRAVS